MEVSAQVVGGIALEGLARERHLKGSENKGVQSSFDWPLAGLYNMTVGRMGGGGLALGSC